MDSTVGYDKTSIASIFAYSQGLIGRSLREAVGMEAIESSRLQGQGKGGLEQMVEELFFHYRVNSDPGPDFREAGLELKGAGLKRLSTGELQIKERLVCDMIDYESVVDETFETSLFYLKCRVMLLLFYLYEKDVFKWDLKFLYSVVWQLPEKDLAIIRHDFETIVGKIRRGEAHLLSEGDTEYLGACRKGQKGERPRKQPFSPVLAPRRAFSLKPAYMRTVLAFVKQQGTAAVSNIGSLSDSFGLVSPAELQSRSFEQIILDRFSPYYGLSYLEICNRVGLAPSRAKNRTALLANVLAAGVGQGSDGINVNNAEEFQKSGIRMKTLSAFSNGRIKEDTSFENIDYEEICENDEWTDSRLYEIFTGRFLFVLFRQPEDEPQTAYNIDRLQLQKAFFWTMPQRDLDVAEKYWENIRSHVMANEIAPQYFWSKSMHRKFHVRPKGRNADDLAPNPNGGMARKYCYWFNSEYITEIIKQNEKDGNL